MVKSSFVATGFTCASAAILLGLQYHDHGATNDHVTNADVRPAAFPYDFDVTRMFPWSAGQGTPTSSAGIVTPSVGTAIDGVSAAMGAGVDLATQNRFGPLVADLTSTRSASGSQATPDGEPTRLNLNDMDQWMVGAAGLADSTGILGITTNAALGDPLLADYAGVLQTSNNLGPAFFDLNVLKALSFTQAPPGETLPSGALDNGSAVDIGRWAAGIPGVVTNTGTTGFVAYTDYGAGPITNHWVSGLHTTTQIGSMTFDYNVLPAITASTPALGTPPTISVEMAPDLTAAGTPFDGPPPPGVIEPPGPTPAAPPAAPVAPLAAGQSATPSSSEPEQDTPADDTPRNRPRTDDPTAAVLPGVNGAPLPKTPKRPTSGGNGGTPVDPFKDFTDAIANGVAAFTPSTKAPASSSPAGAGPNGGEGSNSGSNSGEG